MAVGNLPRAGLRLLGTLDRMGAGAPAPSPVAYEALVRRPVVELVGRVCEELTRFAGEYCIDPERAVGGPVRTARRDRHGFSIRSDLVVRFPRQQGAISDVAGFQLRVSATGIVVQGGTWRPAEVPLARLHQWLHDHGAVLGNAYDASLARVVGPMHVDRASARREVLPGPAFLPALRGASAMHLAVRLAPAMLVRRELSRTVVNTMRRMAPIVRLLDRGLAYGVETART
jgi:hypothetical protein